MDTPTVLDLFCGAGGLSHGLAQAGFSIVAGVDHDRDSVNTFRLNHPNSRAIQADLEALGPDRLAEYLALKPEQIDCLVGGPPCQGFSRNRAFRHQDGVFVDDPRNHLYWYFFEYVAYFRPKIVVMENVPEILIKANGDFRDKVFERFHALGYAVTAKVLNAAEYGVPQWRRRAIFLAGRDNQKVEFPKPSTLPGPRPGNRTPTSTEYVAGSLPPRGTALLIDIRGPSVWDAISDLYEVYAADIDGPCDYAHPPITPYQRERRSGECVVRNHYPWPLSPRQLERIRLLGQGQGHLHLPEHLRVKEGYGSAYRRMQADAQALTITTWMFHPGSGMFTHPFDNRVVTIREAARLQSFQDTFTFTGKYHSQCRQVGNSVAPLLARQVGTSLLRSLVASNTSYVQTRSAPSTFNLSTPRLWK